MTAGAERLRGLRYSGAQGATWSAMRGLRGPGLAARGSEFNAGQLAEVSNAWAALIDVAYGSY